MNDMRLPEHLNEHVVLGLMVEHARNAILLIGKGRRSLYVNQAFLEMTGYEYDEWMAFERSWGITAQRDEAETSRRLNSALQDGATEFRLRPVVRKDGSEIWTEGCMTRLPIAGEGLLLAEFRPPTGAIPDGEVAWNPTAPVA